MSYWGKDLSKYQGTDQVTPDFVILNVEDPYIGGKVQTAYDRGVRWDIYKWCYSGQSGLAMYGRAKQIADTLYRGGRYPQFWLDYEDGGVAPWQIDEWYHACDQGGVVTGLYTYLYLINAQGLVFTRDGWIAYYPGANNGNYYPAMSDTARQHGAKLHQYSSGTGVDLNICIDDPWYEHSTPVPVPPDPPFPDLSFLFREDDHMFAYTSDEPSSVYPFYQAGMMYEFTPYTVRECPGQAATDTPGCQKVTGATMYSLIKARWDVAKALNIPIS